MEKNLDFDTVINRKDTLSLKFDFAKRRGLPPDVLPLWVADMDFKTSSYVLEALQDVVNHGVFGYSETLTPYYEVVRDYFLRKYNYDFSEREMLKSPGVVFAISVAVKALTEKGDAIMIQQPVYYPFSEVITDNNRKLIDNTLVYNPEKNRYYIDFEDFENKIISHNVKMFLLCNPHNPVSRVWSKEELIKLGEICLKHNVLVLSDEIHQDFTFVGKHHIFASLKPEFENITLTCTSPSKTFNLAGLQTAHVFIKNATIRRKFCHEYNASGYSQLNVMGLVATIAAYKFGNEWFNGVFKYIKSNVEFIKNYVETHLPKIKMITHEATYLVWLDFRGLGLTSAQLEDAIIYKSKLWLDSGKIFGKSGEGFQRINAACPRKTLEEAMERLKVYFQ
ncbi:MAG: pyridoxal phosphate-dependent aminotransferase [Bacteroidales bacterium]|nr:pyridoxal phosphate-dependent aminotransferase [Bacteroidales bacterium]